MLYLLRASGLVSALTAFAVALPACKPSAPSQPALGSAPASTPPLAPRTVPGLNLVLQPIPAGTFTMGSPADEPGRFPDEGPQTKVTLTKAFWLGKYAVTQGQWKTLMGTVGVEQARRMLADETLYSYDAKDLTKKRRPGIGSAWPKTPTRRHWFSIWGTTTRYIG